MNKTIVRHILFAWLLAAVFEMLLLPTELRDLGGLTGIASMNFLRVMLVTLLGFLLLLLLSKWKKLATTERWGIVILYVILSSSSLWGNFTWPFQGACTLIFVILMTYALRGWNGDDETAPEVRNGRKIWKRLTIMMAIGFFAFVSIWTVCRIRSFSTPTYDFGLFAQMFYNMKEHGLPLTTLERDGLLSHFHVHVSPIYYLMLPFYCLVPVPETLQVLQAAVLASAVIPMWKLGKGLPDWQRMLLCGILMLYPAFSGGTGYDLHENCFLTPLILWLFYYMEQKKTWSIGVFSILTLMVKEDAAVYVAVIALWQIVRSPKGETKALLTGVIMLLGSLLWFFLVTGFLAQKGDGVMTYRYDNFIYDDSSSLLTVIKAVLMNPMKAVYECMDAEKLMFLGMTFLPLLGLPLMTRRYERLILLIPYILINLMSDYRYQHDIFFQYTFGSTACLMYLTAVNLRDLKKVRILLLLAAFIVCAVCFRTTVVPKAMVYPSQCKTYAVYYSGLRTALHEIPEDASVAASTFYTTQLSQREILYDIKYCTQEHLLSCEYVVLSDAEKEHDEVSKLLIGEGYQVINRIENSMTVFRRMNPST